jgi:prefoldin subunit 5
MERTMWTDERLNERFDGLDKRLDRVDADIRELRTDIREMRTLMFQLWGTNMLAILVTIGAVIATRA